MYYPENFKNRVRRAYHDNDYVYSFLDQGSYSLGSFLNNSTKLEGIPFERILSATSLEELKNEARVGLERIELYNEWCREFKDSAERTKYYDRHDPLELHTRIQNVVNEYYKW